MLPIVPLSKMIAAKNKRYAAYYRKLSLELAHTKLGLVWPLPQNIFFFAKTLLYVMDLPVADNARFHPYKCSVFGREYITCIHLNVLLKMIKLIQNNKKYLQWNE